VVAVKTCENLSSVFYTFRTVHYGKLWNKRPTNAPVVYLFSIIFTYMFWSSHLTIIRVLDKRVQQATVRCINPRYSSATHACTVWPPYGTLTYTGYFNVTFNCFLTNNTMILEFHNTLQNCILDGCIVL
jgi:hypothetical protein